MPIQVKTVKGKTYNIHCDPQEMGYKLGLHIGPETPAVVGQRILHQGRDILEDQTLSEQGIDHTTTLTRIRLFEKYSPKFNPALEPIQTLEIMCENGQSFAMTAFGKETVDQLKARIAKDWNMLRGYECRLFFKGVALGEPPYTNLQALEDYGLPNGTTLFLAQIAGPKARPYVETRLKITN